MTVINEIATITWNGKRYLRWEGLLLVPLDFDPSSGVIVAVAPPGGLANLPALVKGDNGLAPTLQEDAEVTEIEWDDPSAVTTQWVLVTPGTDLIAPLYKEIKTQRKGPPGADGTLTILSATDLSGTSGARKMLGVTFATQKVGDTYWPATITEASADSTQTLGVVNVPAQDFDWRPSVRGGSVVTGGGTGDCVVQLYARLNGETSGNIVARSMPRSGIVQPHELIAAPPAGSADSFNKVSAGASATIHLRAERISGADTFGSASTLFGVKVDPVP